MRRLFVFLTAAVLIATPVLAQSVTTPEQQTPPPGRGVPLPGSDVLPIVQPVPQTAPPAQRAPDPARAPSLAGNGVLPLPAATNIRLDLTITDTYGGTPVKKIVSLMVLNGYSGMIRTDNRNEPGNPKLNVDALAAAYQGGLVSVRMTFEFTPPTKQEAGREPRYPPSLNESVTVMLMDGKPLMISQSADPATDRKVTAELTATIIK